MAKPQHNTVFSVIARLVAGLTIIALFGGLFIDAVASMNPVWKAQTQALGERAAARYARLVVLFEEIK